MVDDLDRSSFIRRLNKATKLHRWQLWAYCLLGNHFHLVVEAPDANLGIGMKWLKAAYAQDFSYRHGCHGHLFGGRFHSEVIEREAHLLEACIYVVLNPVRAGIVNHPRDWPWSSYRASAGLAEHAPAVLPNRLLDFLGPDADSAKRRFVAAVELVLERDQKKLSVAS